MNFGKIKDLKVGDWVEIPFHIGAWPSADRRKPRPGEKYYQVVVVGTRSAQVETESTNYSITDEVGNYPFIVVNGSGSAPSRPKPLLKLPFNYSINSRCWTVQLEASMIQQARAEAESRLKRTLREWPHGHVLVHEAENGRDEIRFWLEKPSAQNQAKG